MIAEYRVGDTAESIGAAEAFLHRIEVAQWAVLALCGECFYGGEQLIAQSRFAQRIARSDYLAREAIEFPRTGPGRQHRSDERRSERAALHIGECVHGLAAVDADRIRLAVLMRMDLAGVAGGASDIEHVLAERHVEMA